MTPAASKQVQLNMGGRVINPTNTTPPRHPASVFKQGANVIFLELPVETRLEIYGYLLEEQEPIALKIIRRQGAPREVARRENNRNKLHRGQVWDRESRVWVEAPPTNTAIMFLNRTVYAEATSVLYGKNVFQFSSTTTLKDFLELLGARTKHLRYIIIDAGGYVFSSIRPALGHLKQAKGLKKLEFAHNDFCATGSFNKPPATVDRLISDCREMLKSLQAAYEAQDLKGNVLDVVSISANSGPCRLCRGPWRSGPGHHCRSGGHGVCRCICSEADGKHEKLCTSLHGKIAKMLGEKEDVGKQGTKRKRGVARVL